MLMSPFTLLGRTDTTNIDNIWNNLVSRSGLTFCDTQDTVPNAEKFVSMQIERLSIQWHIKT